MKNALQILAIVLLQFVSSCGTSNKDVNQNTNKPVTDMHTSQSSLDWDGSYQAVLPCADCEGIATHIILGKDHTYQLSQNYLGKDNAEKVTTGKFTWTADGAKIKLDAKNNNRLLQVGENQLFWLDNEGNRITGDLATNYRLVKQENSIQEKYWKLVSLSEQPVETTGIKETYIIFKQDGNKIIGHGGCNELNGTYMVKNNYQIKIEHIASTEKACPELSTEQKLIEVLQSANNYLVKGDTLILNKGKMATLARFEAVYLQ